LGRTTPSLRTIVKRQLSRMESILSLLPECEAEKARSLLEGIDETISLYTHTSGPIDPLELLFVHFIIRTVRGECESELLGNRRGARGNRSITIYTMGEWVLGEEEGKSGV
jgi:hypothetical protein